MTTTDDGRDAASISTDAKPQPWEVADYANSDISGGGAHKLSTSYVAPLVAAARGYRTFNSGSQKEAIATFGLTGTNAQTRRVAEALSRGDVLYMPWFGLFDVSTAAQSTALGGTSPLEPTTCQWRPSRPGEGEPKYDARGSNPRKGYYPPTPLGIHPATPASWMRSKHDGGAPKVLLAEGLLKADAALTAYLLNHGITRTTLSWPGLGVGADPDTAARAARMQLTALMEEHIAPEDALLILGFFGAQAWTSTDWTSLPLQGREVWIGMDADVSANPHVWRAASQMRDKIARVKGAHPYMLIPQIPGVDPAEGKTGLDDYLAEHGTWARLTTECLTDVSDKFLDAPRDLNSQDGDVRVAADGCTVEQYVVADGMLGVWKDVVDFGGRVKALRMHRVPTQRETDTGVFESDVENPETKAVIEVCFKSFGGKKVKKEVVGPYSILLTPPDRWDTKTTLIPRELAIHPEWPPRGPQGLAWLRAVKGNRPEETANQVAWGRMGWAPPPVEGPLPVFLAGNHVFGLTDEDVISEEDFMLGYMEPPTDAAGGGEAINKAEAFGCGEPDHRSFDDPDYQAELKVAIEAMLSTYVTSGVWTDQCNAAVVVAAGLRGALPLRSVATIYMAGSKGTGKSFSAYGSLAFWQDRPRGLNPIPGSANDSFTYIERCDATAVTWVVDDVAPMASKAKVDEQMTSIGNLVRAHFNGSARGRATATSAVRAKNDPHSVLMITGENELRIASELDRLVMCDMGHGALHPDTAVTDNLAHMNDDPDHPHSLAPARCAQALVKWVRHYAAENGGWAAMMDDLRTDKARLAKTAERFISEAASNGAKVTARHADLAVDLMLPLAWFRDAATYVGVAPEYLDMLDVSGLQKDICSLIAASVSENSARTPGRSLVTALAKVLNSGAGHILHGIDPTSRPSKDALASYRLGWRTRAEGDDVWVPNPGSKAIGRLFYHEEKPYILFDREVAFDLAQRTCPNLISPGMGARSSWQGVTDENFGITDLLRSANAQNSKGAGSGEGETNRRRPASRTRPKTMNSSRVTVNGATVSGYPILLETLFGN